jgi:hypothetical protein
MSGEALTPDPVGPLTFPRSGKGSVPVIRHHEDLRVLSCTSYIVSASIRGRSGASRALPAAEDVYAVVAELSATPRVAMSPPRPCSRERRPRAARRYARFVTQGDCSADIHALQTTR